MNKKEECVPPEELTPEEVLRLCEEAKARGESPSPIIRRYVLQTIDEVIRSLEARKAEGQSEAGEEPAADRR